MHDLWLRQEAPSFALTTYASHIFPHSLMFYSFLISSFVLSHELWYQRTEWKWLLTWAPGALFWLCSRPFHTVICLYIYGFCDNSIYSLQRKDGYLHTSDYKIGPKGSHICKKEKTTYVSKLLSVSLFEKLTNDLYSRWSLWARIARTKRITYS